MLTRPLSIINIFTISLLYSFIFFYLILFTRTFRIYFIFILKLFVSFNCIYLCCHTPFHFHPKSDQRLCFFTMYLIFKSLFEITERLKSYYKLSLFKSLFQVIHYQILKQDSGMVGINDGPKFIGPVELVEHHKVYSYWIAISLSFILLISFFNKTSNKFENLKFSISNTVGQLVNLYRIVELLPTKKEVMGGSHTYLIFFQISSNIKGALLKRSRAHFSSQVFQISIQNVCFTLQLYNIPCKIFCFLFSQSNLDGLLTKLTLACSRPAGVKAETYKNISHQDLDDATRAALKAEGIEVFGVVVFYLLKLVQIQDSIKLFFLTFKTQ